MRKFKYDEYLKERKSFLSKVASFDLGKTSSLKPRDIKEHEVVARLDNNCWQRWKETGKIQEIGNRKIKIII